MTYDIRNITDRAYEMVTSNGWSKDWLKGGCYLFLECAEFVESLRGKGNPIEEAGDVLVAFLSMVKYNNIDLDDIINAFNEKTQEWIKNQ